MRKILFIIPNLKVGGAERVITEMANYLSNDNNVTILTWSSEDIEDYFVEETKEINIVNDTLKVIPKVDLNKDRIDALQRELDSLKALNSN